MIRLLGGGIANHGAVKRGRRRCIATMPPVSTTWLGYVRVISGLLSSSNGDIVSLSTRDDRGQRSAQTDTTGAAAASAAVPAVEGATLSTSRSASKGGSAALQSVLTPSQMLMTSYRNA